MATKIHLPITLKMVGEIISDPFYIKRYDKQSICFNVTLQNYDDTAYSIPDGAEVRILGTKRDGAGFGYTCTDISGNTCVALIPADALSLDGACIAEIFVKWTDGYIRSQSFYFVVEDVACPEETIVSSDDFTYLEQRTAAIDNVIKNAQETINNAIDNMQAQIDAVVAGGAMSDYRVSQALVDELGHTWDTLKDRLDNTLRKSGGQLQGMLIAKDNDQYTSPQVHNFILSPDTPVDDQGKNGDIWLQYRA